MKVKLNTRTLVAIAGASAIVGCIVGEKLGELVTSEKVSLAIEDLYNKGGYVMAPDDWTGFQKN